LRRERQQKEEIPMTDYEPAHGAPAPPPGPPLPGSGQPAGYGQRRVGGFDTKAVNPLDWVAMGAGVLALIFSFFAYYSYNATSFEKATECARPASAGPLRGLLSDLCGGTTVGAWHGFFGWFGVLLALVAAGLVAFAALVTQLKPPAWTRLAALGAAALGLLSTLIALAVVPDWPAIAQYSAFYTSSQYDKDISNGHGFSYWLVLILLLVLTAATFLRFGQTGGSMPAFVRNRLPAGRPGYAPPAGYAPPPPAQRAYPQQHQPSAPWPAQANEPPPAPVLPPQTPSAGHWGAQTPPQTPSAGHWGAQTPPQPPQQDPPPGPWNRP
jgi:hypothetical protein